MNVKFVQKLNLRSTYNRHGVKSDAHLIVLLECSAFELIVFAGGWLFEATADSYN